MKNGSLKSFYLPDKGFYRTRFCANGLLKLRTVKNKGCAEYVPTNNEVIVKFKNGTHSTAPIIVAKVKCREQLNERKKKYYVLEITEKLFQD